MKEKFCKGYVIRFRVIFKSGLNDKNNCPVANLWAVSLLRYSGGIIRWAKGGIEENGYKNKKYYDYSWSIASQK